MDDDRDPAQAWLVRTQGPDPESVGEDEVLVGRLRAEIEASGPITFARFMDRALYEPGHGYYRRAQAGPGRSGDFLTAPEAHPIFGAAIARLLEEAWEAMGRPSPFVVSEHGAGTGALAAAMLGSLRESGSPLVGAIRYRPVEVEQARLDELRARLDGLGLSHLIAGDVGDGRTETGVVVANEVLDALPVHRVVGRPPGIGELFVGLSDGQGLVAVEGPPSDDALAARLAVEGVRLNDGQVAEVCLGVDGWLADASAGLDRGLVVLIDYAEEPDTLYAPTRRDGTLRAFARHAVGGDPFRHVGRQDLTANVDLAAVRAAALAAGLEPVAETTQAELIAAAGSDAAASTLHRPGATIEDALLLRSALARLLDPRRMGGYRVLAYGRRLPANLDLPSLRRLGAAGR